MQKYITHIYILLFVIAAYILLPMTNSEYLYALQENSLFMRGHTFMEETVNNHGGWFAYIACYLTQFFYHPWIGSTILIIFWVVIYYLLVSVCRLKPWTNCILLIFPIQLLYNVLDLGYGLYGIKTVGYPFRGTLVALSIAILCCSVLAIYQRLTRNRRFSHRLVLATTYLSLIAIAILFLLLLPSPAKKTSSIRTTLFDANFRHELVMHRATCERRWDDVLAEAPKTLDKDHQRPTNLMVLYKNIALMNKGELISRMFEYDSRGVLPEKDNKCKTSIARQAAPVLYYYMGLPYYSYRWAIENSVRYYMTIDRLKMLVRCAIMNREFQVAMKYISMLKSTTFHKKWALEQEAMIRDNALMIGSEDFKSIFPLTTIENELGTDDADVEAFIYDHYSNYISANPAIEELALASSLQTQSVEEFMIHFYHYTLNHPDAPVPSLLQEAAYMLGPTDLSPIDISGFSFDEVTKMQFRDFNQEYNALRSQGKSQSDMAEALRAKYGNTYWWFYCFYDDHKPY